VGDDPALEVGWREVEIERDETLPAVELDRMPEWSARTELIAGGVRLVVVAKKPDDPRAVARIRGLGFGD
jgi:hypothetical protein